MKHNVLWTTGRLLVLLCAAALHDAIGSGVVATPDETSLRAALNGGGLITFNCDGRIVLTNTLTITNDTTLDASGHSVTLSGGGTVSVLVVQSPARFVLKNLTIADGASTAGGGLFNSSDTTIISCQFLTNAAAGSPGSPGADVVSGTAGGPGRGGAVYNNLGTLAATGCSFVGNLAQGGVGGDYTGVGGQSGAGGPGQGGAIYNLGGQVSITNCSFSSNAAVGGDAGKGDPITNGGDSSGGCLFSTGGQLVVQHSVVENNRALSGQGMRLGLFGGLSGLASGGAVEVGGGTSLFLADTFRQNTSTAPLRTPAQGGAISQLGGTLVVGDTLLEWNSVLGGSGGGSSYYLPGAPGSGGALFLGSGTATITNSAVLNNVAQGGLPGYAGRPGQGMGGGLYNLSTNTLINITVAGNRAVAGDNQGSGMQGGAYGGGIHNAGGTLTLNQLTIASNVVVPSPRNEYSGDLPVPSGAGIFSTNGVVGLLNTIVANNAGSSNLFGFVVDNGHNLSSDSSCSFTNTGSLNSTDPKLGVLDNYGGPTPTMPLLSGSPAIGGGDSVNFASTDQRGRSRPFGPAPDIGAFESSPPYVIRGVISGDTFTREVQVATSSLTVSTTNHGHYSLEGLTSGGYLVTPESSDYLFVPPNRLVAVGPDQLDVNFKGYHWNALSLDSTANQTLDLVYAGTSGKTYRLLGSTNLVDWVGLATNTIGPSRYFETFVPIDGARSLLLRVVSP